MHHKKQIAFSTLAHLLEGLFAESAFRKGFMQEHSGKGDADLSVAQRSEMLTSIWATVSMLYYVDKVCRSEPGALNEVYGRSGLSVFTEAAAKLRNARDHIGQRIGNMARRKSLLPINGLVRWSFNPRAEGPEFVFSSS
jgi:hypothetical protein